MISGIKIFFGRYIFKLIIIFLLLIFSSCSNSNQNSEAILKDSILKKGSTQLSELLKSDEWTAPDTSTIPQNDSGNLIRYGRALIANTAEYFGPKGKVSHFANGMNCQNCHLDAGTKLYANSYSAVYSIYPKFRARSGTVEHLEKRINDCLERSMNGKKIDKIGRASCRERV